MCTELPHAGLLFPVPGYTALTGGPLFCVREPILTHSPFSSHAIEPHRSYRTPISSGRQIFVSAIVVVFVEIVLIVSAQSLAQLLTGAAAAFLVRFGTPVTLTDDRFLGMSLTSLSFTMPPHDFGELLVWIGAGIGGILILTLARPFTIPTRYFLILNLTIVSCAATYLLFQGHLAYSTAQFSILMLRTMIVTWFVVPLFIGTIVLFFPFRAWHIVSMVLFCTAYDIALGIARYAAFVAILTWTGPILMADLYLVFGPLLDVIPLIGVFAFFLTRLSRRLERRPGAWQWL